MEGLDALRILGVVEPMSSSVSVSSFMKYGSCGRQTRVSNDDSGLRPAASARRRCLHAPQQLPPPTYSNLAEFHLNLLGHQLSPVGLGQEVPEDPSHGGIHPGHGIVLLHGVPAGLHLSRAGALKLDQTHRGIIIRYDETEG